MSNVALAIVDRVSGNWSCDRNQPWQVREAVVTDAEESQIVTAEVILTQTIELVLLPVLRAINKAVAEGELARDPRVGVCIARRPSGHDVGVAVVSRDL